MEIPNILAKTQTSAFALPDLDVLVPFYLQLTQDTSKAYLVCETNNTCNVGDIQFALKMLGVQNLDTIEQPEHDIWPICIPLETEENAIQICNLSRDLDFPHEYDAKVYAMRDGRMVVIHSVSA